MKQVKFNTTMGQFKVSGEAEVTEAQFAILADAGTLQFVQRAPFSNAEKTMAGYEKRPKGFKRNTIPYTGEHAAELKAEVSQPIEIAENVTITLENVEVTQHVPTITEVKFAQERQTYAKKQGDPVKLATLAKAVGYDGELGDGSAENAPVPFLQAIKDWLKAQLEALDS